MTGAWAGKIGDFACDPTGCNMVFQEVPDFAVELRDAINRGGFFSIHGTILALISERVYRMMKTSKVWLVWGVFLLLTACTAPVARPLIELYPDTSFNALPHAHHSIPVLITVQDSRNANNYSNANIDPSQNVGQLLKLAIQSGLQKQGFNIIQNNQDEGINDNKLNINLTKLDYKSLSGYWSSNTETLISADVTVKNSAGVMYKKTYNASAYNDDYLTLSSPSPSKQVNEAFNKLMDHILHDTALLQFMTVSN